MSDVTFIKTWGFFVIKRYTVILNSDHTKLKPLMQFTPDVSY
jgi:hypothetical protein